MNPLLRAHRGALISGTCVLRLLVCAGGALLTPGASSAQAPSAAPTPADTALARSVFAEAQAICARDGGRLWGHSLCGPLLLVEPQSRAAMANEPDSAGVLRGGVGLYTGTFPANIPVANTATQWGGRRWTMLLWPLPGDRYERQRLLAHEMFHGIQSAIGLPMANRQSEHLDTRAGRIWLRLEWRALGEALIRDGTARQQAIADALGFRARRRALFPDAAADENALELNEGVAEYTGLVLSGLPSSVLADRAAVQLGRYDSRESLGRSFAYASGPAYGILLDARSARWRAGLSAASDLGALLQRAYGVTPTAVDQLETRAAAYDGARVLAEETRREAEREAIVARLKQRFVDGPLLRLPMAGQLDFSFDPNAAQNLPGSGTVYGSAQISAGWGALRVERGGVLFARQGNAITGLVVPAPASAAQPLAGDGWTLQLAPGWALVPGTRAGDWTVKGP